MKERVTKDSGMTLVEVVVAMFLLAVVVVAVFPLLLNGVESVESNSTRITAVSLVAERMEVAAAAGPDCSSVQRIAESRATSDADGRALTVTTSVAGVCPASGSSGTLLVTAQVVDDATGDELARGITAVYVRGTS